MTKSSTNKIVVTFISKTLSRKRNKAIVKVKEINQANNWIMRTLIIKIRIRKLALKTMIKITRIIIKLNEHKIINKVSLTNKCRNQIHALKGSHRWLMRQKSSALRTCSTTSTSSSNTKLRTKILRQGSNLLNTSKQGMDTLRWLKTNTFRTTHSME